MNTLFAVKQAGYDGTLVIEAGRAVAADGWWVFENVAGRPLAALPVTQVEAIESFPVDDARGYAWQHVSAPMAIEEQPQRREERESSPGLLARRPEHVARRPRPSVDRAGDRESALRRSA